MYNQHTSATEILLYGEITFILNIFKPGYTEKKKGITCNETESSKRVTDHSRVINALH